jgi:hypothetical protein
VRATALCLLLSACAARGGATPLTGPSVPSDEDLLFDLRFEAGNAGFAAGDGIRITRVLGDRPRIEKDGWYHVQGTWKLGSLDEATLALRCADGKVVGDTERYLRRGSGTFAVTFRLVEYGFLHVSLYTDGRSVGGAYFGQGEGVYRGSYVPGGHP